MKQLEIGPGRFPREGEWDTMDLCRNPHSKITPTFIHDLRDLPYPIADDTYDIVYASHCIEHVEFENVKPILMELRRILKPSGTAELWTPDFAQIVKCYLLKEMGDTWARGQKDYMRWVNGRIYGYGEESNLHRCMLDAEYLIKLMEECGFVFTKELPVEAAAKHGRMQFGVRGQKMTKETSGRIAAYGMTDPFNFDSMLSALSQKKPFAFARYGDGEFYCLTGRVGSNVNKEHKYSPELAKALKEAMVTEPNYHVGAMDSVLNGKWVWAGEKNGAQRPQREYVKSIATSMPFCSSLILHRASICGKMDAFFDAVGPVVLVGPKRMEKMAPWLDITRHIVIPDQNCFSATEKILPQITSGETYLFMASMPAKVWIRKAWDEKTTLIDIGSVFDPYLGIKSRDYMRKGEYVLAERRAK